MLVATCFGTGNLNRSGKFHDALLSTISMVRLDASDNETGYGQHGVEPVFWVITPLDRQPATCGNGNRLQIIFSAPDAATVDRFHETAMQLGGSDEGAPGLRDHTPGYYGAYCRDNDGNKLHVYAMI